MILCKFAALDINIAIHGAKFVSLLVLGDAMTHGTFLRLWLEGRGGSGPVREQALEELNISFSL